MADIILTCPACAKQTAVSEYVAVKSINCKACGTDIPLPGKAAKTNMVLKPRTAEPAPETAPSLADLSQAAGKPTLENRGKSKFAKRDVRRVKRDKWVQRLSWIVFLALGAALYYIRFHAGLPGVTLPELQQYGLISLGVLYLLIIICALHDNMFDGLLAIVVPFYPFYYAFLVSGNLFLRAITAAMLLAFGYDMTSFLQGVLTNLFNTVNFWIRNT